MAERSIVGISGWEKSDRGVRSDRVSGGWMKKDGMVLIPESIKPFTPDFVSSNSFTALTRSYGVDETVVGGGEGVAIGDDDIVMS